MTPKFIQAVVIGGAADGLVLDKIRSDAEIFELERPKHLKPLVHSKQDTPEAEIESSTYQLHVIAFRDTDGKPVEFGLATEISMALLQGLQQLIGAYVKNAAQQQSDTPEIATH